MTQTTLMQIYVGTYAKYNNGDITGEWLDLSNYSSYDEFIDACKELHNDEEDPELMFQDYEGFPASYYNESYISPELWDYIDAINSGYDADAIAAYVSNFGEWDQSDFDDKYQGEWKS
jgi:antirestriction protein